MVCSHYDYDCLCIAGFLLKRQIAGHYQTSSARARSQWALPDLNRKCQIAVGTTGLQPPAPGRSEHYRTSTASARSQWALPDLNRKCQIATRTSTASAGHFRTSTASARSQCRTSTHNTQPTTYNHKHTQTRGLTSKIGKNKKRKTHDHGTCSSPWHENK